MEKSSGLSPVPAGCRVLRSYPSKALPPCQGKDISFLSLKDKHQIFKTDLLESYYQFFLISCPSLLLGCCCDFFLFFFFFFNS